MSAPDSPATATGPTASIGEHAVRVVLDVAAPVEHAYQVFTTGLDRWWIRSHHLLPGDLAAVGVDPHVGGRLWERNDAGQECVWGRVLTWDPPHTFAFSWLIGPDWQVPAPDAAGSRVTVTFTATAAGTRVELVHDDLQVHGPGWQAERDAVGSDGGWPGLLRAFAASSAG